MNSLHQLPNNTTGVIQEITNENLSLTLSELGVMIGEEVRITGRAPLGDPICILCNESLISLRKEDTKQIKVAIKEKVL